MKLQIGKYASYLTVRPLKGDEKVFKTSSKHSSEGIIIDYDEDGKILGIEILTEVKPEHYEDYGK